MRCQPWAKFALGLAALLPLSAANYAQAQAVDELERSLDATIGEAPPDAPADEAADDGAIEELTRGPVHEAFAEQVSPDATPSAIVPKAPPEAIEEVPPENKPADAKAIWIDGYWAWDDVDERYIWISGVWRVAPTGYRWTPGYWTEADGGFRWIGGFWASADRSEVAYQPAPPESLEEGPTSAAPSDGHIWVPGCWYYRDARYVWRPGYWTPGQDNWVWIPNYYRYTPRGYVLCGAYWDVPLATRGCLFAPVFFNRPIYNTPNWFYTPRVSIGLGPLHFHMFVRPNYCHYYFGDYYGPNYARRGWLPWNSFHRQRHGFDPLFAYNVWHYKRQGIDFNDRYDRWQKFYDRHEDQRPRHTFSEQRDWVAKNRASDRNEWKQSAIAERFDDQVRNRRDGFVSLDRADRQRYQEIGDRVRDFRTERAKSEAVANARNERDGGVGENRGRNGSPRVGDNARDLPTMRLPDAVASGGRFGRGDNDRDGSRNTGDGRREDGRRDRVEGPRDVLRPDLDRDGITTPRTGGNDGVRAGDGRGSRGVNILPRTETPATPDATPTLDDPSATPTDSPRTLPREGSSVDSPRDRGDALPTLPRNDRIERTRVGDVDRSSLQPQPGTVRDSERRFNTERRPDTSDGPRGDVDRTPELPRVTPGPSSDATTPRNDRIDRTRVGDVDRSALQPQPGAVRDSDRPFNTERRPDSPRGARGDVDRTPELPRVTPTPSGDATLRTFGRSGLSTTPRNDASPRIDATPRNVPTLPRVESAPRSLDRGEFRGGSRSGLQQPSATPRIQQPTPSVDGGASRQLSPRTQVNRPSFEGGSKPSRGNSSPSFSPRSGFGNAVGGAGSSFTPRSGGGDNAPSFRSGGGGGGGGQSFRSGGGGGGSRSGFSGGGGARSGRGGRD